MHCPKCRSQYLMIRQNQGVERIRTILTGLRGYLCRDCDTTFRAPDRRAALRDAKIEMGAVPKQV
jgi:transposase-like protein